MSEIRIDREKAVRKWSPILENINYIGSKISELSHYCEIHSILENAYVTTSLGGGLGPHSWKYEPPTEEELKRLKEQNLLPMSVRILTKLENLNSDKVTFNCSSDVNEYHYVEMSLNKEEVEAYQKLGSSIEMYKNNEFNSVQKIENTLSDLAVQKINNEIVENCIFDTGRLVKSIELVDNKTDSPKIRLNLRYSIKNN